MKHSIALPSLAAAVLAALPAVALAHPGHDQTSHFAHGLLHPLSGADHILAMVMVGLFAVQSGGRALWLLPVTFVAAMAAGSLAGLSGIAPSIVETGIALSVILLGALLALRVRMPTAAAAALVGVVALFHGHAHGAEAPGAVSLAYLGGFLIGTAALHMTGILAGRGLLGIGQRSGELITRIAGASAAGAGVLLLATV